LSLPGDRPPQVLANGSDGRIAVHGPYPDDESFARAWETFSGLVGESRLREIDGLSASVEAA